MKHRKRIQAIIISLLISLLDRSLKKISLLQFRTTNIYQQREERPLQNSLNHPFPFHLKFSREKKYNIPEDDDQIDQMCNKTAPKKYYLKPGKPINSNKELSLKWLKNPRYNHMLPSQIVTSLQLNGAIIVQ